METASTGLQRIIEGIRVSKKAQSVEAVNKQVNILPHLNSNSKDCTGTKGAVYTIRYENDRLETTCICLTCHKVGVIELKGSR